MTEDFGDATIIAGMRLTFAAAPARLRTAQRIPTLEHWPEPRDDREAFVS